ncbi:MAG: T9SS type A sorting domain-containing protein [Chitinophagales bacterium]
MNRITTLRTIYSTLFLLVTIAAHSQSPVKTFEKTFGGTGYDEGHFISATDNGGYIITGLSESFDDTLGSTYLIETDSLGEMNWFTTKGGNDLDGGNSVIQTTDGGYFVTNHTESFGAGDCDAYIFKTDNAGNELWSTTYGDIYDDIGHQGIQTTDGGFAITGVSVTDLNPLGNALLGRYNSGGELTWINFYGDSGVDITERLLETQDGGFILAGMTSAPASGPEDILVVKTDNSGNLEWSKNFGGDSYEEAYGLAATADGGFVVSGFTSSFGAGAADAWLLKINEEGILQWSQTYGGAGEDRAYAVAETFDGGFILTGLTGSFGDTLNDLFMLRTDALGNQLWIKTFGGDKADEGRWVLACDDGGYAAIGTTRSKGNGDADVYFVKTDDAGNITATELPESASSTIQINPNPFSSFFTIRQESKIQAIDFALYDVTGKLIQEQLNLTSATTQIQRRNLQSGIYFYKIFDQHQTLLSTGKIIAR